ncbi:MAG: family efflux transporter permease subunit [Friedmanniella sp.]|nr:family efflux transporter permease subunit [Friedmanniella sp.]
MTSTDTTAPPAGALSTRDRGVIITLLVAAFVVILNETIMGVALPRLMVDLNVTARTGQWLSTAFLLTMAVVIPTTGFLLQRLPTRSVFVLAMGLFCLGTLLAAVSPGFWMLLVGRVVQATGTAVMVPLLMTTILTLVPPERRGVVMGNVAIAISVAPAIGPTVSGIILHFLPWRFLFVVVLPIALAALVYGARGLVNVGQVGTQRLDLPSVLLSVPAFGGIVYGLSQLGGGVSSTVPLACLAVGVVSLLVFGWRQVRLTRPGNPLLDLGAFRFPMFSLSVALLCIAMAGLLGMVILLPLYLQTIRGIGSLETGLMLLPGGLLMGLLGPSVGRLFDRYGPRALTILGSVLLVVALWRMSAVGPTTPVWLLVGLHLLISASLACIFTPAFTAGLNPLPPHLYSHGSAILTTLQQVAGAAGIALLVAIMAGRAGGLVQQGVDPVAAQNVGIHDAFLVAAGIAVAAVVCSLFMRRPRETSPERADASQH